MAGNKGSEPSKKALRGRRSLFNLHRMRQFQLLAGPLDASEVRLLISPSTPALSSPGLSPDEKPEGAKPTPQPENQGSEPPANWALRRIPAQSPKMLSSTF